MNSLKASDAEAAVHAVAPRVTLADIEGAIAARHDTTADIALQVVAIQENAPLRLLSICILVMTNGFTIIGKSAPASPANFNAEFGKKLAYEDCIRQLWPLMGFALRDRLAAL
jgi:Phage protein (N4 Gp49/phage Sf6 gene 66) family